MNEQFFEAIFSAFYELTDKETPKIVGDRFSLPSSTVGRWMKAREEGGFPTRVDSDNLDALLLIDEVRCAAAAVVVRRADEDSTRWESIAASLSDLLSPSAGWTLVHKLEEMNEVGILSSEFSLLQGAIDEKRAADKEAELARKLAKSKKKRKTSK